ncbi:MAG: hypothetical protein QOH00_1469 [Gaiellales bacterium]|jgi:hypothetical protein|nr:hypothetical protein [Gaiellales bacterium]
MAARDTDPEDIDEIETMPDEDDPGNTGLRDPGIDRHDFASEWESVWEEVETDPREALPELEDIVRRLLVRHGYVLDADDPASQGDEVEMLAPYAAVQEVAAAIREGEDVDPGDLGQAIEDVREIYESLIERVEGRAR